MKSSETLLLSTGTGLQDVAAAIAVYRRAIEEQAGNAFVLAAAKP